MKKFLVIALTLFSFVSQAQYVYQPSTDGQGLTRPVGLSNMSTDARSYYHDRTNFTYRPYQSTAEVLQYLATANVRKGQFVIIVNTGGTLTAGNITGGTNAEWWFRDGVADNNLILKVPGTFTTSKATDTTDFYNVEDYGMMGDSTVDISSQLNALIALIGTKHRNSVIYFPKEGPYLISGALQQTGRGNAQILFPSVAINEKYYTITLKGNRTPTFSPSAYVQVPLAAGTRLKSTFSGANGASAAVFGGIGPAGGANFECSYMVPGFENIALQLIPNPQISGINLDHYTNTYLHNVSVIAGTSSDVLSTTPPTTATSFGIIQPHYSSGVVQKMEGQVNVLGFYNGARIGENAEIEDLGAWSCRVGIVLDSSYGVSNINKVSLGWCKIGMKINAKHHTEIQIFNVERWVAGNNGTPSGWYDFVADIQDVNNVGKGTIRYITNIANVGASPGTFTILSGGGTLDIKELGATTSTGAIEIKSTSPSTSTIASNIYDDNGTLRYRANGYGSIINFYNGGLYFQRTFPTVNSDQTAAGTAGQAATERTFFVLDGQDQINFIGRPKYNSPRTISGLDLVYKQHLDSLMAGIGTNVFEMQTAGIDNSSLGSNLYYASPAHGDTTTFRQSGFGSVFKFYHGGVYFQNHGTPGTAGTKQLPVNRFFIEPTGRVNIPNYDSTDSKLKVGTFEVSSYSPNNSWVADNTYFDGSVFKTRIAGRSLMTRFENGQFNIWTSPTLAAGSNSVLTKRFSVDSSRAIFYNIASYNKNENGLMGPLDIPNKKYVDSVAGLGGGGGGGGDMYLANNNVVTGSVKTNFNATNSNLGAGAIEMQSVNSNEANFGVNLYSDGTNTRYRGTGYGNMLQFYNGGLYFQRAPNGTAGNIAPLSLSYYINPAGEVLYNEKAKYITARNLTGLDFVYKQHLDSIIAGIGGGGSSYTFTSPLVNTSGVVSIVPDATHRWFTDAYKTKYDSGYVRMISINDSTVGFVDALGQIDTLQIGGFSGGGSGSVASGNFLFRNAQLGDSATKKLNDSTLLFKGLNIVGGIGATIVKNHNDSLNQYTVNFTGSESNGEDVFEIPNTSYTISLSNGKLQNLVWASTSTPAGKTITFPTSTDAQGMVVYFKNYSGTAISTNQSSFRRSSTATTGTGDIPSGATVKYVLKRGGTEWWEFRLDQ